MSAVSTLYGLEELTDTITVKPDEDWYDAIGYTDPATGLPVALDGIVISITVRPRLGSPLVLFYTDTSLGGILLLPTSNGGVNSAWSTAVPCRDGNSNTIWPPFLKPGSYVYGVQGSAGGATKTLISGAFIVAQGVA